MNYVISVLKDRLSKLEIVLEDFKNTEYRKSYEIVKSNREELRDAISLLKKTDTDPHN
jgi:hypothetical protein